VAIPALSYSFGIIKWNREEILDRKTRKMLTIHGENDPRADNYRLYVPRKGRKMTDEDRKSLHSRSYEIDGIRRK
jgi:hypothetical protein